MHFVCSVQRLRAALLSRIPGTQYLGLPSPTQSGSRGRQIVARQNTTTQIRIGSSGWLLFLRVPVGYAT